MENNILRVPNPGYEVEKVNKSPPRHDRVVRLESEPVGHLPYASEGGRHLGNQLAWQHGVGDGVLFEREVYLCAYLCKPPQNKHGPSLRLQMWVMDALWRERRCLTSEAEKKVPSWITM